jgi:cytochrome c biogenesis protein CcdA
MGLHFLGVWRVGLLYREARVQVTKPVGVWGAYVMGLAFAFGWTLLCALIAFRLTRARQRVVQYGFTRAPKA